ncbi:MAG TPA: polysaccharide deacetylase family protein [Chloroflexia bacterium]|nr:polysaccharide deacetylase family protein [Chloroflexia bacterium]
MKFRKSGKYKMGTISLLIGWVFIFISTCSPVLAQPISDLAVNPAAENFFKSVWSQSDGPVAAGRASRSWLWGPGPFTAQVEEYSEVGNRYVLYFDKGRMELTHPETNTLTLGLLVYEMISGKIQLGDKLYSPSPGGPAITNVVGDPGNWLTYARLQPYASLNLDNRAKDLTGKTVDLKLTENGGAQPAGVLAGQQLISYYEPVLGHNIPKIFWDYLNQPGLIYDSFFGGYLTGQPFSWLQDVGYPLTEPYWVRQRVGGVEQDVLFQAFQRRTLTFTPANPPQFQVEMGNVGRHYTLWRYGHNFEANQTWPAPEINPASLNEVVRGKTGQKKVAITLDAGSGAVAFQKEIAALDKYGVKITFFLTGRWVLENPLYARQIAADDMEIANHTMNHPDLTNLSDTEVRAEVTSGAAAIERVTGKNPWPLLRFPYGARNNRVMQIVKDLGYRSVFWTYDSLDSVGSPKSAVFLISRITGLSDSQLDGAVILMHLGNLTSGEALDPILANLQGRGFKVVTVSELLGS